MNINFSFDEKNVQVGFENQFVVKDFTNKTLVKLLMLKGEKGDTANSEWGNITGSITNQTDLSNALNNKADTTDIPTDLNQLSNTTTKFVNENQLQAVITSLGSIFTLKGSVATVNDLPSQNNNIGDVYYVVSESAGYIWIDDDGTLRWEQLGMTVDTSDFLTKSGLLSSTGNSTTNTMHQSAITSALYNKADTTDIPTKTSDLTNDSGFITTETDPVFTNSVAHEITSTDITNWNNKSTFSGNYNDLTNKPTIPDELSDLSDDSTHRLVTDTEKSTWNAKSDFSGSYTDLTNKPNIPTKTSDLTNDSGFVTSNYHDSTKQDTLVSGQNIKTINNQSILGEGNINDSAIVESGTNGNGSYIKYSDGTMICYKTVEGTAQITEQYYGYFYHTPDGKYFNLGDYAMPFIKRPICNITFRGGNAQWICAIQNQSATHAGDLHILSVTSKTAGAYYDVIAIGEWK